MEALSADVPYRSWNRIRAAERVEIRDYGICMIEESWRRGTVPTEVENDMGGVTGKSKPRSLPLVVSGSPADCGPKDHSTGSGRISSPMHKSNPPGLRFSTR